MSKNLRIVVKMFLIAVMFSLNIFGAVSILNAAQTQVDSTEAIQIEEADITGEPVVTGEPVITGEPVVIPQPPAPDSQPAEDDAVLANPEAAAANGGAMQILTKESFTRWINPLIILFLVVSFLCWLLALMSSKPADKVSGSANDKDAPSHDENTGRLFHAKPDVVDDLTKIGGVESQDARRLNEAGIWQYEQLRNMTAKQRANLQKKLNMPHIRWYSLAGLKDGTTASVATESKNSLTAGEKASDVRLDFAATPNDAIRSPKFHAQAGVKATEAVTSKAGQGGSNLKSIQDSASTVKSNGKSKSGTGSSSDGKSSLGGGSSLGSDSGSGGKSSSDSKAKSVSESKSASESKSPSESNTEGSSEISKPAASGSSSSSANEHDDLTRLAGIDAAAAERLNAAGIYNFDQLKDLDDQQASRLAEKCRLPNADISDWRRCIYAWGRGIETTSETNETFAPGSVHGVELPQIAEGVFDGEKLVAYPEQVIFRGSNPEGWGRAVGSSIEGVEASISSDSIRSDINYLRIRRTDTRESVVVPMTKGQLFSNGDPDENGWNGSSEVFFGGRHIGVFAQHLPQEVETKFSQGGWGFGHRYDHNDRQEWGWAGRVIEPTSFEVSVGCIGDTPGTVVFRSSDPSIWNTKSRDGDFRFAQPVDSVKHPVNFVRIMREATGEAVIVRVDGNHILDEGFDPRCGWNGSCSEFSGGQHLGVYHCDLAQDFETRFEFGGWGFGHPYNDNDRQAWGWAGRQLPETVFEISLLESVPAFMQHELVD